MSLASRAATAVLATAAAAGAGVAGGWALERWAARRTRVDPDPPEGFDGPVHAVRRVVADDGVPLHVEVGGDADAATTALLVHGIGNDSRVWHAQRRELVAAGLRVVATDLRGHGRSGSPRPESCTVDQVARDLGTVLDAVAPRGPVVVVGHAFGATALLRLLSRRADLAGSRVRGAALLAVTSGAAEGRTPAVARVAATVAEQSRLVAQGFPRRSDLAHWVTRHYGFGADGVPRRLVELVEDMNADTPAEVVAALWSSWLAEQADLDGARRLPAVLLLSGEADRLVGAEQPAAVAAALGGVKHVVLPAAGHMVMLERAAMTNLHLRTLLARVRQGR